MSQKENVLSDKNILLQKFEIILLFSEILIKINILNFT
jgi:hypothetical protein